MSLRLSSPDQQTVFWHVVAAPFLTVCARAELNDIGCLLSASQWVALFVMRSRMTNRGSIPRKRFDFRDDFRDEDQGKTLCLVSNLKP